MIKQPPKNYFVYNFIRATAAPGMLWFRPKYRYVSEAARERIRGGAIVIANHSGYFDPLYVMMAIWYRRHHFVCMQEFYLNRVLTWLFRQFHCIPIDRENFSMDSMRQITEALQAEKLVSIFPEGHLNAEAQIAPFKSGMILMALKSGKPIIPIYISPRKHWYSRLKVCVGERLDVRAALGDKPSLAKMTQAAALLEERERELIALANENK